ncbi:MAG: hypothetical protein DRO96_02120 [Candidatus Aenigmatarchaeota archaeon]|nr:MAG: hypothetical protein DRO96_02120 [Candidatus Aenigmarchaeota archaeon]
MDMMAIIAARNRTSATDAVGKIITFFIGNIKKYFLCELIKFLDVHSKHLTGINRLKACQKTLNSS